MAIYDELEKERQIQYEEYRTLFKKSTYFYLLTFFSFLGFIIGNISMLPVIMIISIAFLFFGIIGGSTYVSKANKIKKNFENTIKEKLVNKVINEHYENASFIANGKININKINNVGLVKQPDRYNGEDLIKGEYKGIKFEVSDVVLTERQVRSNGKSTYYVYVDYFKGRWYVFNFPVNLKQTIKIVESNSFTKTRGLKKYETEMIEFNKKFSIYSSDEHFFYYVMNPYLIERLLILEQEHRGKIYYCFHNDELHIGVNDNSNSLSIDFKKPINEITLTQFIDDIVLIKTIIDELRLDDIKFK